FIDGNLVVNDGGNHFPQVASNSVLLTAGIHSVEVQFHEDGAIFSGVDLTLSSGVTYVSSSVPEGGSTFTMLSGAVGLLGTLARGLRKPIAPLSAQSESNIRSNTKQPL